MEGSEVQSAMADALAPLLEHAAEGSGDCLVVRRGRHSAGVVDDAVAAAAERGVDVRVAVASPHPFGAFEVVCGLLGIQLGTADAEAIRARGAGLDGLRDLADRIDSLCVGTPLLLVVDGAEHVDAASARVLGYLARNLEARSVSLLLVAVDVPPGSWLDEIATALDRPPVRITAGEGRQRDAGDLLEHLRPADREVVEALAVLGPGASIAAVAAVSSVPPAAVLPALDRLTECGLLRRTSTGAGQLVVGPAVLDALLPTRRAELHARAAVHGRSVGESALHVAAHLEHAAPGALDWAAVTLRAGAVLAMQAGDAHRAVRWRRRAIEEDAARGVEVSVPVLLELAQAQVQAGDHAAAATLRLAVDRSLGEERRSLQIRLGRHLSQTGRPLEAVAVLDEVDAALDPSDPAHARTRLRVRAALAAACRVHLPLRERSAALLEDLVEDLATAGVDDPNVLCELAYEHSLAGTDRQVVVELGSRAMAAAGPGALAPEASHVLFLALLWSEDLDGARLLCDRMHGESRMEPLEAHRRGALALAEGDLDLAVACTRRAVADIEWVAPLLVIGARAQLARALTRQGDLDGAAAALRLPGGDGRWRERVTYHPVLLAHAELAAARREWREAASHAEACAEFSRQMGTLNPAVVPWPLVSGRALAELGRTDDAGAVVADALDRARTFGAPGMVAQLEAVQRSIQQTGWPSPCPHAIAPAPTVPPIQVHPPTRPGPALRLLGDTVLTVDGTERRLGDDLVDRTVCIVALSERGVHDEQLAESLWPDGDPAVGRNRLRNVLLRVRQRHGPVVERRGRTIALADDVAVDVREFERLAGEALAATDSSVAERLGREALEHHRGELCPVHPFEAWASAPRAAVRQRWLALLDRLAELAAARGDLTSAMARFEDAVAADPWDEDRYLDAAERLLAAHRRAAARALLQRNESMCAELGVSPSPRHHDLARAAR
ncbi:MAG TPA: BTAD domain-containing putative transcriptional regulator [Acidimicrobiales bacterium]|nr:BTAD domain-containing putative transcriptional regulator [Acidimicrobiales bacterium]